MEDDSVRIELEAFKISHLYPKTKNAKKKKKNKKIQMIRLEDKDMEVDFIGVHTSLVNAYRRIILAEVATMAIEKVYMYNNTSIVQDEVLAHRLGLVPLNVDPRLFDFRSEGSSEWGQQDSVKHELKVKCTRSSSAGIQDFENRKVLSSALKWVPIGNQADTFPSESLVPLHDDILLAKLNLGHEINLETYAVKGIGSDHAKFQPGTTWYRFLPEVLLTKEVEGEDALLLQKCFSPGVIGLDTTEEGKTIAVVNDARYDSCSRNVFQYDSIKDAVKLTRNTEHIIFYVESHSFLNSSDILESSMEILSKKCDLLLNELNKYLKEDE